MTQKQKSPPVMLFWESPPCVILGAHLSIEEAREQFGEEYADSMDQDPSAVINNVRHCWARYEFIGPDNCPECCEGMTAAWILYEDYRPQGFVRRVTVINDAN